MLRAALSQLDDFFCSVKRILFAISGKGVDSKIRLNSGESGSDNNHHENPSSLVSSQIASEIEGIEEKIKSTVLYGKMSLYYTLYTYRAVACADFFWWGGGVCFFEKKN